MRNNEDREKQQKKGGGLDNYDKNCGNFNIVASRLTDWRPTAMLPLVPKLKL